MALTPQNIQLIGMMVIYLIVALEFYIVIRWIRKHKYLINLYISFSGRKNLKFSYVTAE
jgi:hypothetical protein